jgi:hypothetical protein
MMSNLDGSYKVPIADTELVPKKYVDDTFAPISGAGYWELGGNGLTAKNYLGSIGNYDIGFLTNNIERLTILKGGKVGIGTTAPSSKLSLYDGDFEMTNNKSIKIEDVSTSTTLLIGNYADGGGFSYGTNYTASLAVEGDVKGNRFCIEEDCKATWTEIVSEGSSSFVGLTTNSYNGGQGGYVVANNYCSNEYEGSHICTVQEVLYTVNNGDDAISIGNKGWVSAGPPGYTANANDCQGWNSSSGSDYGKIWVKLSVSNSFGSLYKCSDAVSFMCCM